MANYNDIINNKIDSLRRRITVLSQQASSTEITYYSRKTVLTDAQIKTLADVYPELVPAPGAGKALIFIGAAYLYKSPGGVGYDGITSETNLVINYGETNMASGPTLFDNAVEQYAYSSPISKTVSTGNWAGYNQTEFSNFTPENQPITLMLTNGFVNLTGGHPDNTLEVTVFYSIVDL